jgi:hypothetical protein
MYENNRNLHLPPNIFKRTFYLYACVHSAFIWLLLLLIGQLLMGGGQ